MIKTTYLLVVLFVNSIVPISIGIKGYFSETPINSKFTEGMEASLNCNADFAQRVIWYHNSSATKISENWSILLADENKNNRYKVCCKSTTDNTYTLTINEFQPSDAGLYSCLILQYGNDIFKIASAVLSIDPPGTMTAPDDTSPSCDIIRVQKNTSELLNVGDDIVLECQSRGGSPTPQLTLFDDEDPIINTTIENVTNTMTVENVTNTMTVENVTNTMTVDNVTNTMAVDNVTNTMSYRVTLTTSHINSVFKCKLVSAALNEPKYCCLQPLTIGAIIRPSSVVEAIEGADVSAECHAKGAVNPGFTWHVANSSDLCSIFTEELLFSSEPRVMIKDVPLTLNGCKLVCTVEDQSFYVNVSVTLIITSKLIASKTPDNTARPASSNNVTGNSSSSTPIIIGVVLVVVVLCVMCMVVFIHRRRTRQTNAVSNQHEPFDTEMDNVLSPNQDITAEQNDYDGGPDNANNVQKLNVHVYGNVTPVNNFNNETESTPDETLYQNAQTLTNATSSETTRNKNVEGLNYVELDLNESVSRVNDNEQKTVYSHIVLD